MNDPLELFAEWHQEAGASADIVALATATKSGRPSVRMVFYRGIREGGLSFFTNYESRKGFELAENPFAAMVFYWPEQGRQVRVEGAVERLSEAESDAYFASRPLESRISAIVSRQSQPVPDDVEPDWNVAATISRPPYWGGFKLVPAAFEFWVRGEHRRHSRTVYTKPGSTWRRTRLYP
jgi:pyridoxamine 5'-phosphate oxidase